MSVDTGKRTPLHKLTSRNLATILAASGYSWSIIADATSDWTGTEITRQQVGLDIAQVVADAAPISPEDPLEIKRLQLSRLELISNLALQAFIDSGAVDTITNTDSEVDGADGTPQVRKTRTRSRKRSAGDAKYLAVMAQIEEQRNRILGAHAPERREEHGELTVTFAWASTPPQPAISADAPVDAAYRLADNGSDDSDSTA